MTAASDPGLLTAEDLLRPRFPGRQIRELPYIFLVFFFLSPGSSRFACCYSDFPNVKGFSSRFSQGVFLKICLLLFQIFSRFASRFVYCFCFRFPHDLPQDLPTVAVSDLAEHWLRKHLERKGTMQLHLSWVNTCLVPTVLVSYHRFVQIKSPEFRGLA
jgi:hypothetical protein